MVVKIGSIIYNSDDVPISVYLGEEDRMFIQKIQSSREQNIIMSQYPDGHFVNQQEAFQWAGDFEV